MAESAASEFVRTAIDKIPWLLWLFLIALFFWGMILILKQLYSLCHQARKNYITELKEHLNFKDTIITDISALKEQLENQNNELREEARRKSEIINKIVEKASIIITEKETALQQYKCDTEKIIQQFKHALGTTLWIIRREMFLRRMFLSLLTKSAVPEDINVFLAENMDSIISVMRNDEEITFVNVDAGDNFFELQAAGLSPHYLQLPMTEEISLFESLRSEINKLPAFLVTDDTANDNKNTN